MMRRSGGILMVVVAVVVLLTATAQEATTPCPMIKCAPGCVLVKQPNGCLKCACPPTCKNVTCSKDEKCVLKEIWCITTPCFPIPTCVPKNEATKPCPMVKCAPGCEPVKRPNGCSKCACPRTCKNVTCSKNKKCVLKEIWCITTPCFPIPTCVPKNESTTPAISAAPCDSEIVCDDGCRRLVDSNGCPYCDCPATCEVVDCRDGYVCKMEEYPCLFPPCPTHPVCVPTGTTTPCPLITCAPDCVSIKGINGCYTCACPPTCEDVKCAKDEECELKQLIFCITVPCFPTPICVPRNGSCTGTPNTERCGGFKLFWFYNSSANACQMFRYYGCTPSPNTFSSLKTCEDTCKSTQPICDCADDCYTLTKKEQRPECICPNPCRDFNCTADEVCKLKEVHCVDTQKPCNPVPYCAPNTCPTQAPCGIRCMYGLKTDKNGCYLCECRRKPIPC